MALGMLDVVVGSRVARVNNIPDKRADILDTDVVWHADWYDPSAYVEPPTASATRSANGYTRSHFDSDEERPRPQRKRQRRHSTPDFDNDNDDQRRPEDDHACYHDSHTTTTARTSAHDDPTTRLTLWEMEHTKKTPRTAVEHLMAAVDAAMIWDAIALQEIITHNPTEQLITTRAGHTLSVSPC